MSGEPELAGRVAIVTGSARNIGRAIAEALAAAGAAVLINARSSAAEAGEAADAIRAAGGCAMVKLGDVSKPEEAAGLVTAAGETYGRLDILVNNAAVRPESDFAELSFGEWREVLATILDGAFLLSQAALPLLRASDAGAIVNIGGLTAHTGAARRAHVVTAKAGLVGLTRALAHDLAPFGITVNCVAPGMIEPRRGETATAAPAHHARHMPLLGRRGLPREIAGLVRYLAGPAARYITGQTIHANGGTYLG
jgi:3-oxoacyl-[acyl-carrier protein] reductase